MRLTGDMRELATRMIAYVAAAVLALGISVLARAGDLYIDGTKCGTILTVDVQPNGSVTITTDNPACRLVVVYPAPPAQ